MTTAAPSRPHRAGRTEPDEPRATNPVPNPLKTLSSESSSSRSREIPDQFRKAVSADTRRRLECNESAEAQRIVASLADAGFVAYLAGGCVRDAMLGREPKDYDVATDAAPQSVRKLFGKRNTLAFGASFGVIGVLPDKSRSPSSFDQRAPTEVATFRSDGEYSDGRRPDCVHFGNAQQDALRRDFTINGMFYDPSNHCVIDYVGGQEDLQEGVLHTIGEAQQRFDEDKLRMLRAIRFATTLGFSLTDETRRAIVDQADTIRVVSGERVGAEMRRILSSNNGINGVRLLSTCGLTDAVFPEWDQIDQDHAEAVVSQLDPPTFTASLACLLLSAPADALSSITARWKLSGDERRATSAAIADHRVIIDAAKLSWSEVQPVMIGRDIDTVVHVAAAVARATERDLGGIRRAREALQWDADRLDPPPLITGKDLAEMGYAPGPAFAKVLQTLRDAQLNGDVATGDAAQEIARTMLEK